jgi:hypothetical protein
VSLTLEDAVKFALERNLDISVQRLNPQINDIAYASLRSIYHPSLTSIVATQSQTTPATSTLSGGGGTAGVPVVAGLTTYNGGIAQSIPWGGGAVNVALNNNKQTTTSLNVLFNPTFNTNWSGAPDGATLLRSGSSKRMKSWNTAVTRDRQESTSRSRRSTPSTSTAPRWGS